MAPHRCRVPVFCDLDIFQVTLLKSSPSVLPAEPVITESEARGCLKEIPPGSRGSGGFPSRELGALLRGDLGWALPVRGWGLSFGAGDRGVRCSRVWVVLSPWLSRLSSCLLLQAASSSASKPQTPSREGEAGLGGLGPHTGAGLPLAPGGRKAESSGSEAQTSVAAPRTGPLLSAAVAAAAEAHAKTRSWVFLLSRPDLQTLTAP